jgi:predicted DNA-binding transcriptional regulator YafY
MNNNFTPHYDGIDIRLLVSDYLSADPEHARSARELANLLGIRTRRITEMIERERRAGIPILANGTGYFIGGSKHEVNRYVRRLDKRISEIQKTRDALANHPQNIKE